MKLLLDTCSFLWTVTGASEIPEEVRDQICDPANEVLLSSVSSWEIALKHRLGRLALPDVPERYLPEVRRRHGIESLPLDEESTLYLRRLPDLHRDPFDRMLICQAVVHGLSIVTPDRLIREYLVRTVW